MSNDSKIHPRLAELIAPSSGRARAASTTFVPIITTFSGSTTTLSMTIPGTTNVRHRFTQLMRGNAMGATPEAIQTLAARDDVEMIYYDAPVQPLLLDSVPLIGATQIQSLGYMGKGIRVGIVDTGIDTAHPDFTGRISAFQDFTGEGTNDTHGHGTHVAGIVGGSGAASSGMIRGVAPECQFVIAKVLRGDGSGTQSDVIAGLEYCARQNAQVVNVSLGTTGACDGTDAMSVACDTLVNLGIVVCVAAGNAGPGASTVGSPGCAKNVITVGATDKLDSNASFSSRGPTADNRTKPDICFPGVNIRSCRASGTNLGLAPNTFYTTLSGTSMATPHATGACALLLQVQPTLTPQQVKDALLNTAKDLGLDANTQGQGRAQVLNAFQTISQPAIESVTFSPLSPSTGQILTVSITVRNPTTVTLFTQEPSSGFIYDEGDTFISRGFRSTAGAYRVGIDFDNRTGIDHPYRWGLGAPLAPGQSTTITGGIRMKNPHTKNYWAGLVNEYVAWLQDKQGTQSINVTGAPTPTGKPTITAATLSPQSLITGQVLNISITVRNDSTEILTTQEPNPGFAYDEGDTFLSRGFDSTAGAYRVGIDFDNRTGIDHPYRWGLGAPLAPGQSATLTGSIKMKTAQSKNYWAGFVREYVAWLEDNKGKQTVFVSGSTSKPTITAVTFSPQSLSMGQVLNVSITVRNDGTETLTTQGPNPGFAYDEDDTFATRGFDATAGAYRVGIDFDNRTGIDHPYRWGLGAPLAPGQSVTITGTIKMKTAQSKNYWAGFVHEYVAWLEDNKGKQVIAVT